MRVVINFYTYTHPKSHASPIIVKTIENLRRTVNIGRLKLKGEKKLIISVTVSCHAIETFLTEQPVFLTALTILENSVLNHADGCPSEEKKITKKGRERGQVNKGHRMAGFKSYSDH